MLKSKTRWIIDSADEKLVQEFVNVLQITPLVARLLVNRGIKTTEEARSFIYINEQSFHDPFLLKDMDKAVARIRQAVDAGEKIRIFGDYDADGVSSTTVMMTILEKMGANVDFYIPNRFTEGYGPNETAFRLAADAGVKLLITVDTGISAINEANLASELGMDYIITDHHEPGPELPEALAIIHPKLADNTYPFKELAGVGVAFKVAHALLGELPEDLLEITAIGTIADLVPLFGENRLIAARGIEKLRHTSRPGLLSLIQKAGIQKETLNEESIGFGLAPRINAAGRLGSANPAVALLMEGDAVVAEELASEIDLMNKERQALVAEITEEAIREVEENFPPQQNGVLVVGKEGWNSGIIGIVASKLVDRFYRPAIVLSFDMEKGLAKGSARSIEGYDLFKNLSECRDILPHFGGHPMAAGMTLKIEDVDELRSRLNRLATEQLSEEDFQPVTRLDGVTDLEDVTLQSIEEMGLLAPFGMNNPKPKILIQSMPISEIRKIGANQNHLKLQLGKEGNYLDGVGFGLGYLFADISPLSNLSVIGELAVNEWNNNRKPQIFLQDISIESWQLFDFRGMNRVEKWLADIPKENRQVIVFSEETMKQFPFLGQNEKIAHINNEENARNVNLSGSNVILLDMPPSKQLLEYTLRNKGPSRVYVHFHQHQDHFFSTMPTREHFKWFYAYLSKKGPLDVKRYGEQLAKYRGWSRDTIDFISQVFFELEFVTIENGLITLNKNANKRDLSDAPSYKKKKEQIELEHELLYSSYQQLFDWFDTLVQEAERLEEETKQWI
ncbi:single-stranded-DNA-specific exonuclease RecJ [Bacillus sp. V5-8f]|uniref:single-stranded-DNA-specific exonuclease RecJ n=1 Tax=Bacillus sp. V5-8f TaxID=2053044 RepID=UPI000C77787C|nr:single-stranded-DNA-specific exonuclease RecJ [Bacillus sp. V5-8f]PLT34583.1 single-stranded-DNA-specific exonuclease RecJ [Bacillus sp. V5-8f]